MILFIIFISLLIALCVFIKVNTKVITTDPRDMQKRIDVKMNMNRGKQINI